jgi:hypothetical protein
LLDNDWAVVIVGVRTNRITVKQIIALLNLSTKREWRFMIKDTFAKQQKRNKTEE